MTLLRLIRSVNAAGCGPVQGMRQIKPYLAALGVTITVASLDTPVAEWLQD